MAKTIKVPGLVYCRLRREMTQGLLSEKSGVPKRTIERGEKNRSINMLAAIALAKALRVQFRRLSKGAFMTPADVGHLIGNPLFALETNLDTLGKRLEKYNSTRSNVQDCADLAPVFEVLRAVERSMEATKEALHKIKYPEGGNNMATQMCAWSNCQKDATLTLTGEYGLGGVKARNGFCCFEHLIAFSCRRIGMPLHGVTQEQESGVLNRIQDYLSELREKKYA